MTLDENESNSSSQQPLQTPQPPTVESMLDTDEIASLLVQAGLGKIVYEEKQVQIQGKPMTQYAVSAPVMEGKGEEEQKVANYTIHGEFNPLQPTTDLLRTVRDELSALADQGGAVATIPKLQDIRDVNVFDELNFPRDSRFAQVPEEEANRFFALEKVGIDTTNAIDSSNSLDEKLVIHIPHPPLQAKETLLIRHKGKIEKAQATLDAAIQGGNLLGYQIENTDDPIGWKIHLVQRNTTQTTPRDKTVRMKRNHAHSLFELIENQNEPSGNINILEDDQSKKGMKYFCDAHIPCYDNGIVIEDDYKTSEGLRHVFDAAQEFANVNVHVEEQKENDMSFRIRIDVPDDGNWYNPLLGEGEEEEEEQWKAPDDGKANDTMNLDAAKDDYTRNVDEALKESAEITQEEDAQKVATCLLEAIINAPGFDEHDRIWLRTEIDTPNTDLYKRAANDTECSIRIKVTRMFDGIGENPNMIDEDSLEDGVSRLCCYYKGNNEVIIHCSPEDIDYEKSTKRMESILVTFYVEK